MMRTASSETTSKTVDSNDVNGAETTSSHDDLVEL